MIELSSKFNSQKYHQMSSSKNYPTPPDISLFASPEGIYAKIFYNSPIPKSISNDQDRRLVDVNHAWEEFTGYKREEVLGKKIEDLNLISFSEADSIHSMLLKKEILQSYEIRVKRKNGRSAFGLATIQLVTINHNVYIQSSILDLSELKKSQNELSIAQNFSNQLIDNMHESLVVYDLDLKCVRVNKAYCDLTGFEEADIVGKKQPFPHWPPEHFDVIMRYVSQGVKNGIVKDQLVFKKANGERFEAAMASTKITNIEGKTIGFVSTAVDISERIQFHKKLKLASEKAIEKKEAILQLVEFVGRDFHSVLKKITSISAKVLNIPRVSIWEFNNDHTQINCLNAYHLNPDKFKNHTTLKIKKYPNYFESFYANKLINVSDVKDSYLSASFVEDYLNPHGITSLLDIFIKGVDAVFGVICFEHIGGPRKWTDEEVEFVTMIASIVSLVVENNERKKIQKKLLLEKEFSEELIGSMQEGISIVNPKGETIRVNDAFCKMTGFTEKELLGKKPPFKYWPPEHEIFIQKSFEDLFQQKKVINELTFMTKKGKRFPVSLALSTVKSKNGTPVAYFTTATDMSQRVKKEAKLKERIRTSQERKRIISELVSLIGQDYDTVIKQIAKMSSEALNADRVTIWKYEDDDCHLFKKLIYNVKDQHFEKGDTVIKTKDFPEYFETFKSKSLLNVRNIKNHPARALLERPSEVSYYLDAVIHGKNRAYGLICFEASDPEGVYTDQEENFAASVATIISLMVEARNRMEAEDRLIKANDKLLSVNAELSTLKKELEQQNVYLREEIGLAFNYEEMVYSSAAFSRVLTNVETVAHTKATVLLLGESGTGKELLARAIHNISDRNNKPLIKVNCAAIPRELIESELFGHKKGSFTGAFTDKLGKFMLADGGTLFLDEIGELPLEMQPKLLRAIQESEIEQIGSSKIENVDIRIIAATNRDLKKEVAQKNFREDLYFRINVFPIHIPPLRERAEDIPILIEHFVNKYSKEYNKKLKYISEEAKLNLQTYAWPGNVRELENLIQRAVILSKEDRLELPDIGSSSSEQLISSTTLTLDEVQRLHILKTLQKCKWKIAGTGGAAQSLDLKPSTLRDKMKKLQIVRPSN